MLNRPYTKFDYSSRGDLRVRLWHAAKRIFELFVGGASL